MICVSLITYSHENPKMTTAELLGKIETRKLADEGFPKISETSIPRNAPLHSPEKVAARSRYILAQIREFVLVRDNAACIYLNPQTIERCSSRFLIQVDHIVLFAMGGAHTRENQRVFVRHIINYTQFKTLDRLR